MGALLFADALTRREDFEAIVAVGIGIEAVARRLKLDFMPLFVEDDYLLGKRETFERTDVEAIVAGLKSREFSAHVRGSRDTTHRERARFRMSAT